MKIELTNDILREQCNVVTDYKKCYQKAIEVRNWVKKKSVYAITFNQIGLRESCFVARKPKTFKFPIDIVMNPDYKPINGSERFQSIEGCASFPGEEFTVVRWRTINAYYYDFYEKRFVNVVLGGKASIVFQHETDHTNGVVCYDIRVKEKQKEKE